MFIDYKLSIKKVSKNSAVLSIVFDKDDVTPVMKALVSRPDAYIRFVLQKDTLFSSVIDLKKQVGAYMVILKSTNLIIHVGASLLDSKSLDHVIAAITTTFLGNVYNSKHTVMLTHDGSATHDAVKNTVSMMNKIHSGRKLSMTPANLGTPKGIATIIQKIFKHLPTVKTTLLNDKYLHKHGYNLIMAVGKGSQHPPCMLVVERMATTNAKTAKTICIVGKGITFDTGGLSLKPMRHMVDMNLDKTGAIYGAYALLHLLEDPTHKDVNFVGLFPFAENAVSSTSVVPGDVVKSFLGKTVEVTDPDAEGRLVLADALGHAHKCKPDFIIDIATLTGHSESINCWHSGYCYVTPETLKLPFEKMCEGIGERMITMPNWSDYSDILKSKVADLVNTPTGKCSDAFTAALFLKEFVPPKSAWIHIDIAHNVDNGIPQGNGIRSIVAVVKDFLH